jgi:hypothetical protein
MNTKNDNDNVLEASDSAGSNSWMLSNNDQNYRILFPHVATAQSVPGPFHYPGFMITLSQTHHTR